MYESHQEIAWSVDVKSPDHQPARAHVVGRVRTDERLPTVHARRSAGRSGQRAAKARQGVVTYLERNQISRPTSFATFVADSAAPSKVVNAAVVIPLIIVRSP